MKVIERATNPIPGTSVDVPGGATLDAQRCKVTAPCDRGGDVGIHRSFGTGAGDTWHAEAWVKFDSDVQWLDQQAFRARVTIHYYDANRNYVMECAPNGVAFLNDPTGAPVHIETICTIPIDPTLPVIRYIRVNIRAHADKDHNYPTNEMAVVSGSVLVDRFKLTLEVRGL